MNYNRKCIIAMRRLGNGKFLIEARKVQNRLTSAPVFSAVQPQPTTVSPMLDQLEHYINQSSEKDYRNAASCAVLRRELDIMLADQCESVNYIAQGDVGALELSGFKLNKIPTPRHEPEQGVIKKITDKGSGTAIFFLKALLFCTYYELELEGVEEAKRTITATVSKIKVADLPQGVVLKARVRGFNSRGEGVWSPWVEFDLSLTTTVGAEAND